MGEFLDSFLKTLPTGNALLVFVLSLLVGGFVIYKYCLDQFAKPTVTADDNDPWKFVVLRYMASPRQYVIGFSLYFTSMLAIFVLVSFVGPGPFFQILKALAAALTQTAPPAAAATPDTSLENFPTFPVLIAFYMVGLNPNLPKILDFESPLRKFAHYMAYIPKNIGELLNFMRFSDVDMPESKLDEAWNVIDLPRPKLDAPDLKSTALTFNKGVLLYARAAALAGDATFNDSQDLLPVLSIDVFRRYRSEIQNIGANFQALYARLADLPGADTNDPRRALPGIQRDMIKNVEMLYVIFACAITAKEGGRMIDRLRAIGFTGHYPAPPSIPWDPILKVAGAAGVALFAACLFASYTLVGDNRPGIPNTTPTILQTVAWVIVVHIAAIAQALTYRARQMNKNTYYSDLGSVSAVTYIRIFIKCAIYSIPLNLVLYCLNLASALAHDGGSSAIWRYILTYVIFAIVPGACGVMTAYTLDRPIGTPFERGISGVMQGLAMALSALLATRLLMEAIVAANLLPGGTTAEQASSDGLNMAYRAFLFLLYGGLGFVFGFMLPINLRLHADAEQSRLPEKIGLLRHAVLQYFRDFQQFNEWLNTRNDQLEGKRPVDILLDDTGLQRLTSFVSSTRTPAFAISA
jgi:hypothetical protein